VGLLHDLGKLVMGQALTAEAQAEIRRRVEQDEISWPGAERLVVGVDHAELGGFLLGKWRLPEEIVEAVANHHQPELEPFPRLSAVACLSNALAHAANPISGQGKVAAGFGPEVLSALEISPEQFDTMTALVRQSLDRAEQLMTMG
jgi:HD-like signal output (HDOD) protein